MDGNWLSIRERWVMNASPPALQAAAETALRDRGWYVVIGQEGA